MVTTVFFLVPVTAGSAADLSAIEARIATVDAEQVLDGVVEAVNR